MASRAIPPVDATGETIRLEYGGTGDLADVMQIMEASFLDEFGESWNAQQCRSMLIMHGTHLLIARKGDDHRGFAISRAVADEEELLLIAVHPDYRNAGIGHMLMRQILNRAREDGIEAIFLEVRANNQAQRLYTRTGFQKIGVRKGYYTGTGKIKYDAVTYKLPLKSGPE